MNVVSYTVRLDLPARFFLSLSGLGEVTALDLGRRFAEGMTRTDGLVQASIGGGGTLFPVGEEEFQVRLDRVLAASLIECDEYGERLRWRHRRRGMGGQMDELPRREVTEQSDPRAYWARELVESQEALEQLARDHAAAMALARARREDAVYGAVQAGFSVKWVAFVLRRHRSRVDALLAHRRKRLST